MKTLRKSLAEYCGENHLEELLVQWDPERNAPLTPQTVTYGSKKKVWWRCDQGHTWQALVKSRTQGTGCPYCAGRGLMPGFNDLATLYPALAAQWDSEKNGRLTPDRVLPGTKRKVWWRCALGHPWYASVASRTTNGSGCPYCSSKTALAGYNDLKSGFPALAAQWDPEKNGRLTPECVTPYSNRRVWWLCEKGHSYRAAVATRVSGCGCPYCTGRRVLPGFNDLAAVYPTIAAQWHPTLNGGLTPEMVVAGSHKKVWWRCEEGHVWKAVVYSRTGRQKCGCPICAGKVSPKQRERYAAMLREVEG